MSKMLYGKRWPEDFPYRFYIGMHTVDYDQNGTIPGLLSKMDGREIIKRLADAGVDAVMFYASCHLGNCFYPTEVKYGHMHSGLNGRDVFGEAADECQKQQMAFVPAFEFMNMRICETGPREWKHYYPEAGPNNASTGGNCGLCWNTGYGDFVRDQLAEISRRYPIAGIWLDMQDFPGLVCCEGCARRFKEEVGVAPPRIVNPDSTLYKVFRLWGYREEARYLGEMRKTIQEYQADATIVNNTHIMRCEDLYETTDANDYLGNDPGIVIGYGKDAVVLGAQMSLYRSLSKGKYPFEILSDPRQSIISIVPPDPYNAVTSITTAHGGVSGYPSGMLSQYGQLREPELNLTRKSSAFAKKRYPWKAEGESVRFAGLYLSQETENFYGSPGRTKKGESVYLDEFYGAYLMLQEEHLPTDILTRRDLERLNEYPVIYLPNTVCLSEEENLAVKKYVHNGGTLISSYRVSLGNEWNESHDDFGLAEVLGVSFCQREIDPYIAMQLPLPEGLFETADWENRDISLPQSALICKAHKTAKVLVNLHDRYRTDSQKSPVNVYNGYTKEEPEGPGMVENFYGKGRSIYFSGKIFTAYYLSGNPSLRRLAAYWPLKDLLNEKLLLKLKAPTSVEMTAYAQKDKKRILVHLVNFQSVPNRFTLKARALRITEDVLPVYDLKMQTKFNVDDISAVKLQPEGIKLDVEPVKNEVIITVPKVHIHDIIEITLKDGVCPEYPDSNKVFSYKRYDLAEKVKEWLATDPPEYNPDDNGTLSFDKWLPVENYLTDWQVAAFETTDKKNLEEQYPPEKNYPDDKWKEAVGTALHKNGVVNIDLIISGRNNYNTVGYARCFLNSAKEQKVKFCVTNDDACKIYLNEEEVFKDEGSQERGAYDSEFEADLQKGNNVILLKKIDIGHNKQFALQITNFSFEIICSASPGGEGRVVTCAKKEVKEWDGQGEMQE